MTDPHNIHPGISAFRVEELVPGVTAVFGLSNAAWIQDGPQAILVDTCANHPQVATAMSLLNIPPLALVIYTHGHRDHVLTQENASQLRWREGPNILAHHLVLARLQTALELAPYTDRMRAVQFGEHPIAPVYQSPILNPTQTYHGELCHPTKIGPMWLYHVQAETEDATIIYVADQDLVLAGDTLIGSWPNVGNPFKEPRFGREWIAALKQIRDLCPQVVLPGHGPALRGGEVANALADTIDGLEFVNQSVINGLNQGHALAQVIEETVLPPSLHNSPYLQQKYSRVELAVIAFYRSYTGWWDGDIASLFPTSPDRLSQALANAVDPDRLMQEAATYWRTGDPWTTIALLQILLRTSQPPNIQSRATEFLTQVVCDLLEKDDCLLTRAAWISWLRSSKSDGGS